MRGGYADTSPSLMYKSHHARYVHIVNPNSYCTLLCRTQTPGAYPNEAYVEKTPSMITVQGQNRAAMTISVFAQAYGLPKHRAGRCGSTELFDGGERE